KVRVVVIDGITIGHPCCGIHNCPEPLISNRHRFCYGHNHHDKICAVWCGSLSHHHFVTTVITRPKQT
ncbi:hypothetical protein R3P38DRAFT_2512649, partial [Favolaschia claudopus]